MKLLTGAYYFPSGLRWTWTIGSIGLIIYHIFWSTAGYFDFFLVASTLFVHSTKYETRIDLAQKRISDSFIIFWVKLNEEIITYDTLDKVVVSKNKRGYTANSRSRDRQVNFNEYIGNLHYDNEKTIEVARSVDFEVFSKKVNQLSQNLNLPIEWTS